MSESPYVYDVTEAEFAEKVIEKSHEVPVLADFWADWCGPCRMLAPILHKLAEEYGGKLIVAKINSDAEQSLAARYGIRSLPTVKLFKNGQVVDEFMGVQPESQIRALLDRHIPRESDAMREEALAAWRAGDADAAIALLRKAMKEDPGNERLLPDLVQILLAKGEAEEAQALLQDLPANRAEDADIKRLKALAYFAAIASNAPDVATLKQRLESDPEDLQAKEQLAARWILDGQYEAGMDLLLEIMRKDRKYGDDAGRKGLLAAFELLGDDPRVTPYRRQMFNLLH